MVKYICKRCGWETHIRTHYRNHLNRKKSCKIILEDISIETLKKDFANKIKKNNNIKSDEKAMKSDEKAMKNCENTVNNCEKTVNIINIKNSPIKEINGKYECPQCKKLFKAKRYLNDHLKRTCKMTICKMNVQFDNIYTYDINTFGKKKYGLKGGDIYIVQIDHDENNYFKIGKTINLYNRMRQYRINSITEPRLYYYYPFSSINVAYDKLKKLLYNYHIKRELYQCELNILRDNITLLQKEHDDDEFEYEPIIKDDSINNCKYCGKTVFCKNLLFDHWKECEYYINRNNKVGFNNEQTLLLQFMSQQMKEMKEERAKEKEEIAKEKEEIAKEIAEMAKEKEQRAKEIAEIKKQHSKEIETLLEKVGSTVNNTYIKEQKIIINSYGKENLDYISTTYLTHLLKLPYSAVQVLIKNIHFHPQHPENHNVKITNKKLPYASVWKDDKWVVKDKKEVIEDMVDKSYNMIDEQYNENIDLEPKKKRNFKNFQLKYDDHNKNLHKTLQKDTEMLIINNSKKS